MSQLFGFIGGEDFCNGESLYSYPKKVDQFFPISHPVEAFNPRKRARISAPILPSEERFELKKQTSIDSLPDECICEILKHLPGGDERSACASVSKRWLMLVSSIKANELSKEESGPFEDGFLTRCLEGKRATDVRLASIAVGTGSRGGLGKLIIRGSNTESKVTNHGLSAISRCCPHLKVLSMWNIPSVGDEGLIEISKGCNQLEKLDLSHCPLITDQALTAIAMRSPNLNSLILTSCKNIGNNGLQAIGKFCPKLKSVSIKDCPLVGDQGIAGLLSSSSNTLAKVKLEGLNISDVSLAVVGHYCRAVTELNLTGLQNVGERGFWCMGNGHGLQMLKTLVIESCKITDLGVDSLGKGCPNLKMFSLRKCSFVSDNGLVSFVRNAGSLESLQLDECHRITQLGFFSLLLNCGSQLKAFSVSNCFGINEMPIDVTLPELAHTSIRSLTIRNCPFFGDVNLALLSNLSSSLQFLDLSGLAGISDEGMAPMIDSSAAGFVKVNVSGCVNLTDKSVLSLTKTHGGTLELLNLEGCVKVTDASLAAIANHCLLLNDLDVSRCAVTDIGVSALGRSRQQIINMRVLSLSGCSLLSDKCMPFLAKLSQNLVGLNLKNCHGISSSVVDMLSERMWNCDILS